MPHVIPFHLGLPVHSHDSHSTQFTDMMECVSGFIIHDAPVRGSFASTWKAVFGVHPSNRMSFLFQGKYTKWSSGAQILNTMHVECKPDRLSLSKSNQACCSTTSLGRHDLHERDRFIVHEKNAINGQQEVWVREIWLRLHTPVTSANRHIKNMAEVHSMTLDIWMILHSDQELISSINLTRLVSQTYYRHFWDCLLMTAIGWEHERQLAVFASKLGLWDVGFLN